MAAPVPETITTPRLVLSRPTTADLAAITACCRETEVQKWTVVPSPYTPEVAAYFLHELIDPGWARGSGYTWGIRVDGAFGGLVGLEDVDEQTAGLGFWLAADARGRGYMTEAARAVVDVGFRFLDLQRLSWSAYAGNIGSARVALACGFHYEGLRRLGADQRGVLRDEWIAGVIAADPRPTDPSDGAAAVAVSTWPAHVIGRRGA